MKKFRCFVLLFIVAVFFATLSASAETFRNPVRIPTGSDPTSVFIADLNNDGRPDILWGGYGSTTTGPGVLHTLLTQASGGYVAGPILNLPANVSSACFPADETGDGKVDLVCPYAYQFDAGIYTFPGKGDGSFDTPIVTPIPTFPNGGAWVRPVLYPLAGTNGDAITGLIMMNLYTQSGYVMLGNGHGSFTKSSSITGYGTPQVVDVNSDGKADILFAPYTMWLGRGDGTFIQSTMGLPTYSSCVFHDMDSDGKPDAVCGLPETVTGGIIGGTQLLIFHANGDGTFNPTPIKTITYGDHTNEYSGQGTFQTPVAVLDLNGDGILDILATAGDGFTVILGQGELEFDSPAHYATGYIQAMGTTQIADLKGDGLPELVGPGPNGIYITCARKDGTLDTAPAYEVTQVIGYQALADFDEDGILDIAATGDASIKLNLGKGDGTFQAPVALPSGSINFSTPLSETNAHILHGDFNGDHHQDILAIGSSGIYQYDSYVLFGDGKGSFSSPQLVPSSSIFFPMYDSRRVVDLNQDGRDDLFSTDYDHLYAFLSNGDGTFTTTTTAITSNSGQSGVSSKAALADFDHDGNLDAVWAAGSNIMVCKGHGDGSFNSSALNLPIPTSVSSTWLGAAVTSGDFDGDGNQDFAVLLDFQNPMYSGAGVGVISAVYVFHGAGDGTFGAGVLAGKFNRPYTSIYTADLSNQGLSDLILKTSGSLGGGYAVGIVHSLPNRVFGSEVNYYAGTGLADLSIADLNHDGFRDLLFSNGDYNVRANSVTVLLNQGNPPVVGTLSASPEPSQYNQALTLDAAFIPSSFTPVTGAVAFTLDGTSIGSATISSNKASLALSTPILPGTHSVTATWPGNSIYSAVTLSAAHQVEQVPSSVTLTSDLNPSPLGGSVTFTASISSVLPVVGGTNTVTFFDGQTQLGAAVSVAPGKTATFVTSNLGHGSHSITAAYSGNSQVLSSTSSALTETIPYFIGDFSIKPTPAAVTVAAGQPASFQLAITPSGGFNAPMALSCSGLPALATCVFNPSALPSGQGQVALTIQTVGSTRAALSPSSESSSDGAVVILAGLIFCLLPSRSTRKRLTTVLLFAILSLPALLTTSCGGGGGSRSNTGSYTPAGSYQVSVTAQTTEPSQNISHSTIVNLIVQ